MPIIVTNKRDDQPPDDYRKKDILMRARGFGWFGEERRRKGGDIPLDVHG